MVFAAGVSALRDWIHLRPYRAGEHGSSRDFVVGKAALANVPSKKTLMNACKSAMLRLKHLQTVAATAWWLSLYAEQSETVCVQVMLVTGQSCKQDNALHDSQTAVRGVTSQCHMPIVHLGLVCFVIYL